MRVRRQTDLTTLVLTGFSTSNEGFLAKGLVEGIEVESLGQVQYDRIMRHRHNPCSVSMTVL